MTMFGTDTYGAKKISRRENSARTIIQQIIDANPRIPRDESFAIFLEEMESPDNKKYLISIMEYFHTNHFASLANPLPPRTKATDAAARAAALAAAAANVRIMKVNATRMVLLDVILPNGKALRDSTGKDCARAGGWLTKVAAAIKPSQKVGDALSEAAVRKLFRS